MFKVTTEWLEANSNNGGYSAKQLNALGISWPPIGGWKKAVVGNVITDAAKRGFEEGRKNRSKKERKDTRQVARTEFDKVRDLFASSLIEQIKVIESKRQSYAMTNIERDAIAKMATEIIDMIERG